MHLALYLPFFPKWPRIGPPSCTLSGCRLARAGEDLGRVVWGDKGGADKRLSLLLCDQRKKLSRLRGPLQKQRQAWTEPGPGSLLCFGLTVGFGNLPDPSPSWPLSLHLCPVGPLPRLKLPQRAGCPGGYYGQDLLARGWVQVELDWGGASGTPAALTEAPGSEPRQAELPTVRKAGQWNLRPVGRVAGPCQPRAEGRRP